MNRNCSNFSLGWYYGWIQGPGIVGGAVCATYEECPNASILTTVGCEKSHFQLMTGMSRVVVTINALMGAVGTGTCAGDYDWSAQLLEVSI
jgi:hypothetical protein